MRRLLIVLLLGAASSATLMAQATGSIVGTVTDESGAVLPGVTIEVTNVGTGQTRNALTREDGYYSVPLLRPGSYQVKGTLNGFKTSLREGVTVTVETSAKVDMKLAVGGLEETVTVSADAPLVETSSATLGIVVNEKQIVEAPLNGRNFTQLGMLLPGVIAPPAALGGSAGDATPGGFGAATAGFSVNGMRSQSNNFLLDGASNNDTFNTGFVLRPPPDAIQEFKILTHSVRRRVRPQRRIDRQRRLQERHQRPSRRRLGVQPRRCAERQEFLRPTGSGKTEAETESVRFQRRWPGHAEPNVRLRLLRGVPQHQRQHAEFRRPQRRAAAGRFRQHRDPRSADRSAIPEQPDSREPHRSSRHADHE